MSSKLLIQVIRPMLELGGKGVLELGGKGEGRNFI